MKRLPANEKKEERPRVQININRKILGHSTIRTIKDAATANGGMLSGSAIMGVLDDLQKLRYVCEGIVDAHQSGNQDDLDKGLHILGMII